MLVAKNTLEVALKELDHVEVVDTYRHNDLREFAEKNNLTLVIPGDNQLLIDIDNFEDRRIFDSYFEILKEKFPTATYTMTKSRNKVDGRHITITVPGKSFTNLERIAYQAVLGSDRKRELLSLFDILKGDSLPTVFFEKK